MCRPCGAVDLDVSRLHVSTDPMDARQIAMKIEPPILGRARNVEHLGQRQFFVAVVDFELLDV